MRHEDEEDTEMKELKLLAFALPCSFMERARVVVTTRADMMPKRFIVVDYNSAFYFRR